MSLNLNKPLRHPVSHAPMRYLTRLKNEIRPHLFAMDIGEYEVLVQTAEDFSIGGNVVVVENVPEPERDIRYCTFEGGVWNTYEQAVDMTKYPRLARCVYKNGELNSVEILNS